jgi:predicted alpha/beta superfamily hydrolase
MQWKKIWAVFFLGYIHVPTTAQHKVTLKLHLPTSNTSTIFFVASNKNGWNPQDRSWQFQKDINQDYILERTIPNGLLECKITKGAWDLVEMDATGKDVENRVYAISSDTTILITVSAFKDDFTKANLPIKSTASAQVKIISDSFFIPQLNVKRRLWIYLPKNYDGKKRFPVLYMHDGQNLFDANTSGFGEWGVDEFLDSVKKELIVVGIDHGGSKRLQEYNPYPNENPIFKIANGKEYAAFIVNTLKKYIDQQYKTLPNKKNTYLAGSSMGGLITFYTVVQYPTIFGKVGIFSPSFWTNRNAIKQAISKQKKLKDIDFYFYAGTKESEHLVVEVMEVYKLITNQCKNCNLKISIKADGEHNEKSWNKELPNFFSWLLR